MVAHRFYANLPTAVNHFERSEMTTFKGTCVKCGKGFETESVPMIKENLCGICYFLSLFEDNSPEQAMEDDYNDLRQTEASLRAGL